MGSCAAVVGLAQGSAHLLLMKSATCMTSSSVKIATLSGGASTACLNICRLKFAKLSSMLTAACAMQPAMERALPSMRPMLAILSPVSTRARESDAPHDFFCPPVTSPHPPDAPLHEMRL